MTPEDLKNWRKEYGLSQKELAELLEVKQNTVARWETGNSPILKTTELALQALAMNLRKENESSTM